MSIVGTLEWFAWPLRQQGGQHVTRAAGHVMLLHHETGIAVVETSERSQHKCRQLAIARLTSLLEKYECGRWTIPTVLD